MSKLRTVQELTLECDLLSRTKLSQSALSRHLAVLREAGLTRARDLTRVKAPARGPRRLDDGAHGPRARNRRRTTWPTS